MLPEIDRDWILGLANVFLIRAPERVVASYAAKREAATLQDIGFVQQAELFDLVAGRTGKAPPVIDAEALRADPEAVLRRLCAALAIPFDRGDAVLARRSAGERWRLGCALVRCGAGLHRVRRARPRTAAALRGHGRARRRRPSLLRAAAAVCPLNPENRFGGDDPLGNDTVVRAGEGDETLDAEGGAAGRLQRPERRADGLAQARNVAAGAVM